MEKERESLSRLSLSEFKLATNKTLGYETKYTVTILKSVRDSIGQTPCSLNIILFINFSSCKPDTENDANFVAVSSKRGNFDAV